MGLFTILDTETGQVMVSIILGLGLAALFQNICNSEHCFVYQSPNNIDGRIFSQNGKCYTYSKEPIACKQIVKNS